MKRYFLLLIVAFPLVAQIDSTSLQRHLLLGNPSNAAHSASLTTNYLMIKPQYVLSYHRFNGTANWTAWHLDSTWLGEVRRKNDFRADSTIPEPWYRVQHFSYRRSGYDRGHLCPSADRTVTQRDNSMTFLMTNMIPQAPNNNQGPWAALENYCRELAKQQKELYIYSGGYGSVGFLDSGRVNIPEATWKVIVVLDAGENDLRRVTASTRTIAVEMPNDNSHIGKYDDWRSFRVSNDRIETMTGFDFLSAVPDSIQLPIERIIDNR